MHNQMLSNTVRSVTYFARQHPRFEGGCALKLPEAVKALFIARCSYQRFLRVAPLSFVFG